VLLKKASAFGGEPKRARIWAFLAEGFFSESRWLSGCSILANLNRKPPPTCFFGDFLRFSSLILENIFMVFLGSSCMQRNGQKCDKQNRWEKTTGKKFFFSQLFWPKGFDMDFLQKVFCRVFELPLLRNSQKRHKKPNSK
jgi:hypothetical protein